MIVRAIATALRRGRIRPLETRHTKGYRKRPARPGEFDVWTDEQDWGGAAVKRDVGIEGQFDFRRFIALNRFAHGASAEKLGNIPRRGAHYAK